MIFGIEVWLTISAWRKGWRWALLIPLGIAVFVGLFVFAAYMLTTGEAEVPILYLLIIDLAYVVSAGILSAMTPGAAGTAPAYATGGLPRGAPQNGKTPARAISVR